MLSSLSLHLLPWYFHFAVVGVPAVEQIHTSWVVVLIYVSPTNIGIVEDVIPVEAVVIVYATSVFSENENISESKLEKETGLAIKASDMKLLDDIYYVYEPKDSYMVNLVKSVGEDWLWSYTVDWMFLVVLNEPVDITKSKILNDGKSSWYLVDYILRQPDFLKRYVNIRSIIKDTIK